MKKNKESTLAESVRIDNELPDLENKVERLVGNKQRKDEAFEKIEMEVRQKTENLRK